MAVRDFDGSDDVIIVPAPAYFSGAFTWVGVLKREATGAYHTPISIGDPAQASSWAVDFTDGGDLQWESNRSVSIVAGETLYTWNITAWGLFAITFDGGTVDSDYAFHHFDGTDWFHGPALTSNNLASEPHNWVTAGGATLQLGRWSSAWNYFNGKMVMQALNIGTELSEAAIEALAGGNKDDYVAAGFDHLWEFSQDSTATAVEDYIGSLDQTSISGTTVATGDDPSPSIYSLAVGGGPVNTTPPSITGTAAPGQGLSCSVGAWDGDPTITYAYQWKRNGSNISGETDNVYTVQETDVAQSIKCAVTATNSVDSASEDSNTVVPTAYAIGPLVVTLLDDAGNMVDGTVDVQLRGSGAFLAFEDEAATTEATLPFASTDGVVVLWLTVGAYEWQATVASVTTPWRPVDVPGV